VIDKVSANVEGKPSPAAAAGLKRGDRIISLEAKPVKSWGQVRSLIRSHPGRSLDLEIERAGRRVSVTLTPVLVTQPDPLNPKKTEQVGQIGVTPSLAAVRENPIRALLSGAKMTGGAVVNSITGIKEIFSVKGIGGVIGALGGSGSRDLAQGEPIGLVGAGRLAGQATSAGAFEQLIVFFGGFIVFVGVMNLFPLPPLDGGHLLVLLLEKVMRRKIDARKVIPVAGLVLTFFIILSVALLYLDLVRPVTDPFQ
jgi:regulator of sigma E protease